MTLNSLVFEALNRYRAQEIDWLELKELSTLQVTPASLFIGGEYDPVRNFKKVMMHIKRWKVLTNFKGKYIIKIRDIG